MNLRMAEPADALAVAQVHVRTWQIAYRGLMPGNFLDQLRPDERAGRYDFSHTDPSKPQTIVAVDDRAILGFATVCPSRDADLPNHGELCALYVDPAHWGSRIGGALSAAARARLVESGFREAFLWVLTNNVRARRFYELDGWHAEGKLKTDVLGDLSLEVERFRRPLP